MKKTDFQKITFAEIPLIEDYLQRFPQTHSETSPISILCWDNYSKSRYAVINDHLFLTRTIKGETMYNAPIGKYDPNLFEEFLLFAKTSAGKYAISFYEDKYIPYMKEHHPETPVYHSRGCSDYYYRTDELANLHGQKYINIRGQINQFNARYQYATEQITPEIIPEVHEMLEKWGVSKHTEANLIMKEEVGAAHNALDNWEKFHCEGLALRILPKNKIGAIAIWNELNNDTALIHFEKGFTQYKGIYKIINQETARILQGRYEWINRESDMDVPGLREAKLRYHPEKCAKAWYIKRKEIL